MSSQPILTQLKNIAGLLVPILAPIAYRKGMELYHAYKSPKRQSKIRPLGLRNLRIVTILVVTGIVFLFGYAQVASRIANPNLLQLADARIQTPGEVLKSRIMNEYAAPGADNLAAPESLAKMPFTLRRTAKYATQQEWDRLFSRMLTLDGRLLYTAYGTSAYLYCDFCRTDIPYTFFLYSLPSVAAPYLISLITILLVTCGPKRYLATVQASQWAQIFCTLCITALLIELGFLLKYPKSPQYYSNKFANDWSELHFPFEVYVYARAFFLGVLHLTLAALVFLGGTGRAYDNSFSADGYYRTTQKLVQLLDFDINKLRVATLLHSDVIAPNSEFRKVYEQWGAGAEEYVKSLEEDEAVKEAKTNAKQRKQATLKTVEVEAKALVERL